MLGIKNIEEGVWILVFLKVKNKSLSLPLTHTNTHPLVLLRHWPGLNCQLASNDLMPMQSRGFCIFHVMFHYRWGGCWNMSEQEHCPDGKRLSRFLSRSLTNKPCTQRERQLDIISLLDGHTHAHISWMHQTHWQPDRWMHTDSFPSTVFSGYSWKTQWLSGPMDGPIRQCVHVSALKRYLI